VRVVRPTGRSVAGLRFYEGDAMVVGAMSIRLLVGDAMSLKDKRRVVKSLKERLSHRFNASVAEVGDLDHHRLAELGVAVVSNDAGHVRSMLDSIINFVRGDARAVVVDWSSELL
jgi:uncharacterized protein YlxP (DUF503 family)